MESADNSLVSDKASDLIIECQEKCTGVECKIVKETYNEDNSYTTGQCVRGIEHELLTDSDISKH